MPPPDDFKEIFAEVGTLFELSLAVGGSLDLQENCRRFLSVLLARKNLGYAAVWLRDEAASGAWDAGSVVSPGTRHHLAFAMPSVHAGLQDLVEPNALIERLAGGEPWAISHSDPTFIALTGEAGIVGGCACVFPLREIGFLKLHAFCGDEVFGERQVRQLSSVIDKFAVSIEGCLALRKVQREVADRQKAEEERAAMREQWQQAQKLEAIGRLAGGVAHDFNNLLTGILGCAELLRADATDPAAVEDLDVIINACGSAAELTGQLLAFSRRGEMKIEAVSVHAIVAQVVTLLTRTVGPGIHVKVSHGAPDDIRVRGDASRLQNAFLNLGLNARDALEGGGTITFCTSLVHLDDEACRGLSSPLSVGSYLLVQVQDDGRGMPAGVRARLFEPFFTTKAMGRGTGLGLAAVYGIVQTHKGMVDVQSALSSGSVFSVYLPVWVAKRPPVASAHEIASGAGRVLVVDDDANVRMISDRLLRRLGYQTCLAHDGQQALEVLAAGPTVDMVLLDVRMPRLDGRQTLAAIRARFADLPVVIVSGFGAEADMDAIRALGIQGLLEKPFSAESLAKALQQARP